MRVIGTEGSAKPQGMNTIGDEPQQVNTQFSRTHAMSIHINLIAVLSTLVYGMVLASKSDCPR